MAGRIVFAILTAAALLAATGRTVSAEVISTRGATSAQVTQIHLGQVDGTDALSQSYPETSATLPLQTVVRLVNGDTTAAGAVAAQFADPRTSTSSDPDEFAITLALSSVSADFQYTGHAVTEEIRGIRYTAAEVSNPTGQTFLVAGRLFLDGALALFAAGDANDLTGASVVLRVTVTKEVAGADPVEVFSGSLDVEGGANLAVNISAGGGFPTNTVLSTDLSGVDPSLRVFRVFVFPNFSVDYTYEATLEQDFALHARIEVQAANIPNQVGVAALIGTPLDALTQVISQTQGEAKASKMLTALASERATPTGEPAFPQDRAATALPSCGLFGVESLLGLVGLVGLRRVRHWS